MLHSAQNTVEVVISNVKARTSGLNVTRNQLLAAMLLPFFVVACFAAAAVVKEIVVEFVPDTFPAISAVAFFLGIALVIGACAACFAWVKSGGFGIFD